MCLFKEFSYGKFTDPQSPPLCALWFAVFCYAALVALLLQLVVLPLIPSLHGGNGLLAGGDWLGFHDIAARLAQQIREHGWQVWELRPERQAPAGIAAAIYAATVSKPWALIPLNAALHASAAILLLQILTLAVKDWRIALCGVLPFIFYPSAMMWYAQIHRDGFYIAGIFLCLYGWLLLLNEKTWATNWRPPLFAYGLVLFGVILIWVMREYGVELMRAMGGLFAIVTSILMAARYRVKKISALKALIAVLLTLSIPVILKPIKDSRFADRATYAETETAESLSSSDKTATPATYVVAQWQASALLPDSLNNVLFRVARTRAAYFQNYRDAGSIIDRDVVITRPVDFVTYTPRALQIGLFAPFPAHWFESGKTHGGSMMRKISAVEMLGTYLALLFLPYALLSWRRQIETWLIFGFGLSMTLVYTFVTPNLGSLYRMRYGFLMLLVGLGVSAAVMISRNQRQGRDDVEVPAGV